MKSIYVGICLVVSSVSCWGAATDEFKFVSTLSSPVASFGTVETKSCLVTKPLGQFNIGTKNYSSGGLIDIKGGPIYVNKLYMEDGTKIESEANIRWLVDTLNVGKNAVVQVQRLIASDFTLNNSTNDANLTVNGTLRIEAPSLYVKEFVANGSFQLQKCSDAAYNAYTPCFTFSSSSGSGTASWGKINKQTYQGGAGEESTTQTDINKYYPISTAF